MGAPASPAEPAPQATLPIPQRLLSDERLARLVEDGGERAFAIIYERYHQRLYRYCRSLLRDGDDAYDALQSTLVNALAALQRGRRDAPLRPWLFRIAHNESISIIRRREPGKGPFDVAESCVPSAEARADARERLALLVSDLAALPERQRAVLLMRELNGLSRQDIASALGLSTQTVGRALLAARRSLGEFEEGRAMVCEQVQRTISLGDGKLPRRDRAHVRDCSACATFAAAIPARRADLQALAPPLAPIPAAALLALVHGATSTQGAGGGGLTAAGLSGKTAGAALAAKALTSVAIVAVATASATGLASKLTATGEPSFNAAARGHAGAPKHRPRHAARSGAPRARVRPALATRFDATPAAGANGTAGDPTGNAAGASSHAAGTAPAARTEAAAVSSQPRPARGGAPVHAGHPHGAGAGAVHGRAAAGAGRALGAGARRGAASANGSSAATRTGREPPSASSAGGHAGGGQARPSEPTNEAHGRPAETANAPSAQAEPPSPAGGGQLPAHEQADGQEPGAQRGDTVPSSAQTSHG
jgi:RNA polymerase sigma factor (sigma-70 family)